MDRVTFFIIIIISGGIGFVAARSDNRDMAICQLSHSEAVCFHTLNR